MADQTPLNDRNGRPEPPAAAIRRNVSDFAHDVSALADLQWKLLAVDLRTSRERLLPALFLAAASALLFLAALPVLLLGGGRLLAEWTDLSLGAAYLLTAAGTLVVAAILGAIAYARFKGSLDLLQRSRAELQSNFQWIKSALQKQQAPSETSAT